MRVFFALPIFMAISASKSIPPITINEYLDDYKQIANIIKGNLTGIGDFIVEVTKNFDQFTNKPTLSGVVAKLEKDLLKLYDINQESIKTCIEEKNIATANLSLKIAHKKESCKWNIKPLMKQLNNDLKQMTEIGIHMIDTIKFETNKCLKSYFNDKDECKKCLLETRKPILDQTNIFINESINLMDSRVSTVENYVGIVSVCLSDTQRYIRRSEKYIAHNLEECFLNASP